MAKSSRPNNSSTPLTELRRAIVRGAFRDGQPLRQDELAERFGTSTIPVREALRELSGEGLVQSLPNRGFVVSELNAAEMRELCAIRVVLETYVIRMAIPNLTSRDFSAAKRILDESDRDTDHLNTWAERNWEFHSVLYRAADRPILMGFIERANQQVERYLRAHVALLDYRVDGQSEHRALLAACRRRDVELATRLLTEHIASVEALLAPFLEQREPRVDTTRPASGKTR